MNETNRLLREYAEQHSEPAFRELVERYIDLVYSVAVRRTGGDAHRAEDIVQTVFTDLARKAPNLPPNVQLGGWLHKHCCFVASTVHRTETRRLARERQAMDLLNSEGTGESSWQELAPVLDEAIQELQEPDREALVMRYFEKRDLRAVGAALGTTEDAAQKRVSRALDKLRGLLAARGVALSLTALTPRT
jgi:RNA polymerase sigma factor (sigma-70 family)